MSEQPVSVSADDLHAASEQAATWEQAVRRAEGGETVAVLAHGRHVADVVPSGEIDRLRETIEVLSDDDLVRDLRARPRRSSRRARVRGGHRGGRPTPSRAAGVTEPEPYRVVFTATARRSMYRLTWSVATAMYEHVTGPVADNPYRLGKQLDPPLDALRST